MLGTVKVNGEITESFPITTGVKRGIIIAPTLLIIHFDAMRQEALRGCEEGNPHQAKNDGSILNLTRLRAKTKTKRYLATVNCSMSTTVAYSCTPRRTFNCCLKTLPELQRGSAQLSALQNRSHVSTCTRQPLCGAKGHSSRRTPGSGLSLHLGSKLSHDGQLDTEIDSRIAKASNFFGRLYSRVWSSHDLKPCTKMSL